MNKKWSFSLITVIVGFMLAVQYETIQHPKTKDTRDEWELKESLKMKQEEQLQLLQDIQRYEQQLSGYEEQIEERKEEALQNTLQSLQKQAGLTDVTGKGIVLQLSPLFDGTIGQAPPVLAPQLLQRLVNELNTYGATAIQIADQRVVATTAIREINGKVSVNDVPLPALPFEIKVLAKDEEKLFNRMKASSMLDYFAIDNIELQIERQENLVTVMKYDLNIHASHMKSIQPESGEK